MNYSDLRHYVFKRRQLAEFFPASINENSRNQTEWLLLVECKRLL